MPMTGLRHTQTRRQRGYTLLEILVASVLLTGGLIGLASLQASGTRLNNSAYLRTQANVLAYDIIDRMRANSVRARAGNYDIALADAAPPVSANPHDIDLIQWRAALAYYLPAGNGSVTRVSGGTPADPARITVTVQWNDGRAPADVVNFVVTTDL
ncbi:MAG: type IV pilus modification protein PilV [Pseudomonadota bacterium]